MSDNLPPWYAIATPHDDIQKGRLSEAIFAANLWSVVQGTAPEIYCQPEAFFAKTYLTQGLTNALRKVGQALSGSADSGDRIISLQTSFGGGKTHVLVALWHLALNSDTILTAPSCADLRRILKDEIPERIRSVAVFTHQTCDATQGRITPEGVRTRTLWGELALQLGGLDLYREIEANDQARTCPQGLFESILRQAAPCLILLDELADYCVTAAGIRVESSTLADQTISFIQQLSQAVSTTPGVAVVATLPASHLEVSGSERGQEILVALESRFGRMGADTRPVADEEISQVVRRRLFDSLGDPTEHTRVIDAYLKMYQAHPNEVSAEATRPAFRQRMLEAYPFHPALIDALYLRWGSHNEFQRTRGVLRLLASIIGNLWQRRSTETQSQALIQPCHINWTIDSLSATLTRLWGAAYEAVIASDIVGDKSNSIQLDEERGGEYTRQKITQGLAATILLGSFGGQADRGGYSTKDLKLCVARPDLNWGYTDGALLEFENRAFYLQYPAAGSLGKRYWFDTRPTLVNLIVRYRQQYASNPFNDEILETLRSQVDHLRLEPATWRVIVSPNADLPEQRSLTLLVMSPETPYTENGGTTIASLQLRQNILTLSQKCGAREREYRNTLLFLLPNTRGLIRLRNAIREVTALNAVSRDYGSQLDPEQKKALVDRQETARKAVIESLGSAYAHVARIKGETIELTALSSAGKSITEHLQIVWKQLVEEEEWILRKVGRVSLQETGLIVTEGSLRLKDAVVSFLRYTDKPQIATREAVTDGLRQACKEKIIALGRGLNPHDLMERWCGEDKILDPNEEGVWIIPAFEPEPVTTPGQPGRPGGGIDVFPSNEVPGDTVTEPLPGDIIPVPPGNKVSRITITGNVPTENWTEIFRCFISPGVRMNLKHLRLGIDFELVTQDGIPLDENDPALKAMIEAAKQLGLKITQHK